MEDPAGTAAPGNPLFHQHGHCAVVGIHRELFQQVGRRGGNLLIGTLIDDLPGNMPVIRTGITGHLAMEGWGQIRHTISRICQQSGYLLWVIDVDGFLAGCEVGRFRELLYVVQQGAGHLAAHRAGAARRFHQHVSRMGFQHLGVQLQKIGELPIPDRQHRLVIAAEAQGPLAHRVHVGGNAARHAAQELLGLGHGFLLALPLFHQRRDDYLFLLLAQVNHPAARVLLHAADLHVPRVGGVVAVDRLGDSRGDEEHPVQVTAVLAQGLAYNEGLGDARPLGLVVPIEVHVHIHALAGAIIHGAVQIRILGNLPAVFPLSAHLKILVR